MFCIMTAPEIQLMVLKQEKKFDSASRNGYTTVQQFCPQQGWINPLGGPGAKMSCGLVLTALLLLFEHYVCTRLPSKKAHTADYPWQVNYIFSRARGNQPVLLS